MAVIDSPRIVTARAGYEDSFTLARYLATGGYDGLRKALTMFPEDVAKQVDDASLLGRGGAGFPAGRKWSMLRKAPISYLVVNGDESEPATFKDHFLVERDPHQLIEGIIISAYALQVSQAFLYLRGEFALGLERVQQALNDAYELGALGSKIFGSDFSLDLVVHPGAGAYICGEETALIEGLEGKRGFPRIKPPFFPAVSGLYGEPTVVNNVETMANVPWIVLNGGAAFAALGGGRSTGTRMFALAGRVNNPGIYEIEMVKNTFRDLIFDPAFGGGIINDRDRSRPSSPVGSRRRGSGPICSICPWVKTRSPKRVRCWVRGRSSSSTRRVAWCARPGASRSSSPASPVVSARRVAKARAGSNARCTA
jgi:NADH-quinone oxidoreductase subunit F